MNPIGLPGGLNTYTYVVEPLGWVDLWGLAACAYGSFYTRIALRQDVFNAQKPGSYHAKNHIQARTAEDARLLSLGKGARRRELEASYLPQFTKRVIGFEKEAAYDATRKGNVFWYAGPVLCFTKKIRIHLDVMLVNELSVCALK